MKAGQDQRDCHCYHWECGYYFCLCPSLWAAPASRWTSCLLGLWGKRNACYALNHQNRTVLFRTDPLHFTETGACLSDHVHRHVVKEIIWIIIILVFSRDKGSMELFQTEQCDLRWVLRIWELLRETVGMWRRTSPSTGTPSSTRWSTRAAPAPPMRWWTSGLPLLTTSGQLEKLHPSLLVSKWKPVDQTSWLE